LPFLLIHWIDVDTK